MELKGTDIEEEEERDERAQMLISPVNRYTTQVQEKQGGPKTVTRYPIKGRQVSENYLFSQSNIETVKLTVGTKNERNFLSEI